MDQLKQLLNALTTKQKIAIVCMAIAVVAAAVGLTKWQHERSLKPLYSGLAPEDAAAIVQKLKESGVEHRVAENGTVILVPESRVAELRLEMAGAGIPKSGRIGFELFDKTNLGATDFTEHVNYRRAIEGELERSVRALSEVEEARVHVTFPRDSVFLEAREPAKASVLVKLRAGSHLKPQNVAAITNLVANAVEGLETDSVSVLDMSGNLLSRSRKLNGDEAVADQELEYKERVEKELLTKINSTLEPVLGDGRFRAGVSVDCDFVSGDQSEETFDPQKSVMATSQRTDDVSTNGTSGGVPGTASNLPQAPPRVAGPGNNVSRKTESVTYQTSRVVRHVKIPQGTVKRMSASILLDQEVRWEGVGAKKTRVLVSPPADQIKTIHDLVAGAIGLAPDRGDQLIIESLPFESTRNLQAPDASDNLPAKPVAVNWIDRLKTDRTLQIAVGGAALLGVLLLFVVFRLLRRKPAPVRVTTSLPAAPATDLAPLQVATQREDTAEAQLHAHAVQRQQALAEMHERLKLPPATTKKVEALKQHLTENVTKDPAFAATVLRGWIQDHGE